LVSQGIITEGMSLNLGPFEDGTFRSVVVTSIKRNRAPCRLVRATQSAALAIECHVNDVRKGMVLVDTRADDIQCTMLFKVTFLFIIFLVVLTCFDRFVSSFFQTSFLS
jgi:GTPase